MKAPAGLLAIAPVPVSPRNLPVERPFAKSKKNTDAAYALVTRDVPMGRAASPDDVANAVLFLASPLAAMVSGSSLMVDGGASAVDLPTIAFAHDA